MSIINLFLKFIKDFFSKGEERTLNLKKNVFGTSSIRAINIILSFVTIPITIHYLNQTYYGVWITLLSIVNWLFVFDIGLGNGLKNKLAESLAVKDYHQGKIYVSTSYAVLSVLFGTLFLLFFIANLFLDWSKILNISMDPGELRVLTNYLFLFFSIQFVLRLINTILIAHQKNFLADIINALPNIFLLVYVFLLSKFVSSSLFYLAVGYNLIIVFVLLCYNIYYFSGRFKQLIPSYKFIRVDAISGLFNLGIKFFFLQIGAIILYSTSNIIITQYYGPKEVTNFNLAHKYFNTLAIFYGIIMDPLWISVTDAFALKDYDWIKRTMGKISFISLALVGGLLLMIPVSDLFFRLWVGKEITISLTLKLSLVLYFAVYILGQHYTMFVNGAGKVRLQLINYAVSISLFFPLSIFLIKYTNLGVASVVTSSFLLNVPAVILLAIQYRKIVNQKAKGIWNA